MAAAIKAINARIRQNKALDYVCSTRKPIPLRGPSDTDEETDFWGPVSNFGIPIAAVADTQKDAEM